MPNKRAKNEELREEFEQYYKKAMEPNLRLVIEKIGMNYHYFMHWKSRERDIGWESLHKIEAFLAKYK